MKTPIITPFAIIDRVAETINRNADRVLTAMEKNQAADEIVSNVREYIPFYNKLLPKFTRRTYKIEFYPESAVKKSETVFNNKGRIIKAEQFDAQGDTTYFETYNPLTKKGFVRTKENGVTTEKTFKGSDIVEEYTYDSAGNITSHSLYNPNVHN